MLLDFPLYADFKGVKVLLHFWCGQRDGKAPSLLLLSSPSEPRESVVLGTQPLRNYLMSVCLENNLLLSFRIGVVEGTWV